jgi:hypothetical protein
VQRGVTSAGLARLLAIVSLEHKMQTPRVLLLTIALGLVAGRGLIGLGERTG